MPKTKFQEIIFTVLMVFVMVYVMICYNIALNIGGMQNHVFTDAFHELVIMAPIAFVLDFFFVGMIAKRTAFRLVDPAKVAWMCPLMSLAATILFKDSGSQVIAVWLQTTVMNFPMAFFWQIFFAGPLVRFIFRLIFSRVPSRELTEA